MMPNTPVNTPPVSTAGWATLGDLDTSNSFQAFEVYKSLMKVSKPKPRNEEEMSMVPLPAKEGFKFGCDPELFVLNEEGIPVSAAGLIPGTKANPFKVEKGAVQVDGMAAEFNIDPVTTFIEFHESITAVMKQLKAFLPKGYTFSQAPAVTFSEEIFDNAPVVAKELGCTPDFNAWTGMLNPPPNFPSNPRLRTASGHLHIGWVDEASMDDLQHILNCRDLVKQLDWYLGAWSVRMDADPTRRQLYGQAGACRYKSYGVEYRVLSNFWLFSKERRLQVWNRMMTAINDMANLYLPERAGGWNDIVISSINNSNLTSTLKDRARFPIMSLDHSYVRF